MKYKKKEKKIKLNADSSKESMEKQENEKKGKSKKSVNISSVTPEKIPDEIKKEKGEKKDKLSFKDLGVHALKW